MFNPKNFLNYQISIKEKDETKSINPCTSCTCTSDKECDFHEDRKALRICFFSEDRSL